MKKNLLSLLIILLSAVCSGNYLSAQEIESSGTWGGIDWTLTTDGTLTIKPTTGEPVGTGYKNQPFEVGQWREAVVYNSSGGASAIGGWPYDKDRAKVKNLIIEEGVTSIGSFTAQFPNLTGEVVIPKTVTYFGQEAFQNAPITKLTFAPGGKEELCIGPGAFKGLKITELVLPGDRPKIHFHSWAFNYCEQLETVIIPANTTFMGQSHIDYMSPSYSGSWACEAFAYCWKLRNLIFPSEEVKTNFFNLDNNRISAIITKAQANGENVSMETMVEIMDVVVAKVSNTYYQTIDEAIANWTNNTTLTLLADVTLSDVITFNSNGTRTLEFSKHIMNASNGNKALIVSENNTITLQNGTITSNADYVISTSGNLTIQDMTINGTVEYLGGEMFTDKSFKVSAKKDFIGVGTDHTQNWSTISTPIADAKIPEATVGTHDLYRYNEEKELWEYFNDDEEQSQGEVSNPFDKLELGRGYLYANAENITLELEGNLNVASIGPISLNYTEGNSLAGFNFIGNPFTHTITRSNIKTSPSMALSTGFYVVGANGTWIAKTDSNDKIAPMESVLIKANGPGDLIIHSNNGSKRAARNENSYLTINVASKTHSDVAHISFNEEGMGLDKINHRNPDNPMIYIPVEGKNYAVAVMNKEVKEVPVHFNANRMAEYTISIESKNCDVNTMTLVDRLTGVETNMLIEDYTFMARTFDDANRFVIRMSIEENGDSETENFAYVSNGSIVIEKIEGNANIRIFDIMGRHIMGTNATGNANIPVETMSTGMYIIQMSDDNGVKVQKIIIE